MTKSIANAALNPARVETPSLPLSSAGPGDTPFAHSFRARIIGTDICEAEKLLALVMNDAAIRTVLEMYGYDTEELERGERLITAAQSDYENLSREGGELAGSKLALAFWDARQEYSLFREIARACFPGAADRLALSLAADLPDDRKRFIAMATASYSTAQTWPYTTKFTKRNYPQARLENLLAALHELTVLTVRVTGAAPISQLIAGDSTHQALKAYMQELKGVARGALRDRVGALKKLESQS